MGKIQFKDETLDISLYARKETRDSASTFYIVRKLTGDKITEYDTVWVQSTPAFNTPIQVIWPTIEWFDSTYND